MENGYISFPAGYYPVRGAYIRSSGNRMSVFICGEYGFIHKFIKYNSLCRVWGSLNISELV